MLIKAPIRNNIIPATVRDADDRKTVKSRKIPTNILAPTASVL